MAWRARGQGTKLIPGQNRRPYQITTFPTPPFAGYVSGHSALSSSAAEVLKLFTGRDRFGGAGGFPGDRTGCPGNRHHPVLADCSSMHSKSLTQFAFRSSDDGGLDRGLFDIARGGALGRAGQSGRVRELRALSKRLACRLIDFDMRTHGGRRFWIRALNCE